MPVNPDDIDDIAAMLGDLYREAELAITRDIARHLEQHPGAPTAYADARLDAVRALRRSAEALVAALQATSARELREAVAAGYRLGTRSVLTEIPRAWFARSGLGDAAEAARAEVPQTAAVEALAAALVADVGDVTANILRDSIDAYRAAAAGAAVRVLAAGQTRREASAAMWANLVKRGITGFTDRAGRRWRLSTYVEMATRTAVARAAVQGQTDRLASLGLMLAYVSDHAQECPRCAPFEGRVVRLDAGPTGTVSVPHALTGEPVDVEIVATLAGARARGLMHPNCRHSLSAYLPGVTRPPKPVHRPEQYEARMRQRHLERRIREAREVEAAALTDTERRAARRRVRARQAALREHLDAHPYLKRLRYREQVGAGSTPPDDQLDDPAGGIGPDVQPDLDGGGEQLRRRRDDGEPEPDTAPDTVEVAEGQLTLDDAEADASEPTPPARPRYRVSRETRARLNELARTLPSSAEEWRALTQERYRLIDQWLAEAREELDQARAALEAKQAEVEAEFKRRRTPHARRAKIMRERTADEQRDVEYAEGRIRSLEDTIARYERGEQLSRDDLDLLEWRTRPAYPRDSRGNRMPPEELLAHLDDVLDIGTRILDDAHAAFAVDAERLAAEERAAIARREGRHDDADQALREMRRRESEIIREVLASVRDLGGHQQRVGDVADDAPANWLDQVRTAEQYYPTDWLELADARGPLNVLHGARQFFRAGSGNENDTIALNDDALSWYDGAFQSDPYEITVHELGHRMEQAVPGLTYLEFALVRRRATRADGTLEEGRRLRDVTGNSAYADHEITYEDQWANPYAGKSYEWRGPEDPAAQSWELFQTSVQDLWGRGSYVLAGTTGQRFALGVLAALGREPDRPLTDLDDDELAERLADAIRAGWLDDAEEIRAEIDRREVARLDAELARLTMAELVARAGTAHGDGDDRVADRVEAELARRDAEAARLAELDDDQLAAELAAAREADNPALAELVAEEIATREAEARAAELARLTLGDLVARLGAAYENGDTELAARLEVELARRDVEAAALAELTVDELAARLEAARRDGNPGAVEAIAEEYARRGAELPPEPPPAETPAQRRRREREEAQYRAIARLVEVEGYSWEQAAAEVLGRPVEAIRREQFLRDYRPPGDRRGFREIAREQYRLYVHRQFVAAEAATRGYLITAEARARGIDPESLFSGPRARAERWASEELKRWWDEHGRMTFAEYIASIEQGRLDQSGRDYNR